MPLILLLGDTFGKWKQAVERLDAWNQIVTIEQTLLARARSVFMGRWFGLGLPLHDGDLRVAFANLDALVKCYRELKAGSHPHEGLNLTEPLMGMAGELTGMLTAPVPSMIMLAGLSSLFPDWTTTLAEAVNWLSAGVLMPLVGVLGGPIYFLIYLPLTKLGPGLSGVPVMREFFGAGAEFLAAAGGFLLQLVGPREGIRNPLVSAGLDLLGHVANLLPLVMVLVSLVVLYLGPLLSPLAQQLTFLVPLVREIYAVIMFAWTDFSANLAALYTGKNSPWNIVKIILRNLKELFIQLKKGFWNLFKPGQPAPPAKPTPAGACEKPKKDPGGASEIMAELRAGWAKIRPLVMKSTRDHWLIQRFREISSRFTMIAGVWSRLPAKPPKPPGTLKKKIGPLLPPVPPVLKTTPAFPTLPDFPLPQDTYERLLKSGAGSLPDVKSTAGDVFNLDDKAQAALNRLHHPPGVFAAESLALEEKTRARTGKTPAQVLAELQAQDSRIRTLLFGIIDRFLPAAVAEAVPMMQGLLWELEDAIHGEKALFPVREVIEGELLAPEITRLRIRAPGMKEVEVRQWVKNVRAALTAQPYRTMAAAQES